MTALVASVVSLAVGAGFGYFSRRAEQQRERQFEAFTDLIAAFLTAAETGTALLSVHIQTGYPEKLNDRTWSIEQIQAMRQAHSETFMAAIAARNHFEKAMANVEMVGKARTISALEVLRHWLWDALYSGVPWRYVENYPKEGQPPREIVGLSQELVRSFVKSARRDLWGRHAAKELPVPQI